MQVLIIGNTETTADAENYFGKYVEFMRKAVAEQANVTVRFTLFHDLYVGVGDGKFVIHDCRHDSPLSDADVILLRGGGYRQYYDLIKAISVYAKEHGNRAINDYSNFRNSSKLTQAVQFHQLGLPVAYSVYVTQAVLDQRYELGFGFPCVLKATFGSHGDHNFLVNSMAEAVEIVGRYPSKKKFVLQRFVPNEGDYRVLLIGERIAVIGRKSTTGSHLNNTSQGAQASLEPLDVLPDTIIEQCKRISSFLDMEIAGVDVLKDKESGNYYFLEVNAQPQLMTGAYLDKKAEMLGAYFGEIKQRLEARNLD